MGPEIILILHDIRSAHNVGAMFRTADGAGVMKVFLSGYTQTPADPARSWKTNAEKALAKTALGAEYAVPWERADDIHTLMQHLRSEGFAIVSLECGKGGADYRSFVPDRGVALVVGNETEGISGEILRESDVLLEIPMRGTKESLNVSVATGIALFSLASTMESVVTTE
ncbi:MAG: RNA methyltransferase [Candidatus Moranbacteria bacterium]|nr:RNA methyltransferase [Candidatus Moranbacteria bacterium]